MKVVAKLPRAGLANKLLIWCRAVVFTHNNNIPLDDIIVYPWIDFPLKRLFNRDKRFYSGFFKTNDLANRIKALPVKSALVNPSLNQLEGNGVNIRFEKIGPFDMDYFAAFRGYEVVIRKAFNHIISDTIQSQVASEKKCDIALHVRRGDFGGDLATPVGDFLRILELIRSRFTYMPLVFIFTDGTAEDVAELLALPNTKLITGNSALYDLLLMSKAKVIVPSIRSTFSYFASFVSEACIVRHAKDSCGRIRLEGDTSEAKASLNNNEIRLPETFWSNLNL